MLVWVVASAPVQRTRVMHSGQAARISSAVQCKGSGNPPGKERWVRGMRDEQEIVGRRRALLRALQGLSATTVEAALDDF